MTASAIRSRAWRQARGANIGAKPGPAPSALCGTVAAYKRHVRNKQPIDDACRQAMNKAQRDRRKARQLSLASSQPSAYSSSPIAPALRESSPK